MTPAARNSLIGSGALASILAGCAGGPRLYSTSELGVVAERCGVAQSELDQLGDPRFLFLLRPAPSDAVRSCVSRWAKRHDLHAVFIDAINSPLGPNDI